MSEHFDKREIMEALKLEINMIRDGRYLTPRAVREPLLFRSPGVCLGMGPQPVKGPCMHCFLIGFVPPEHRAKETACHYIPLNSRRDTITSLLTEGDTLKLEAALLTWLYNTVARLEKDLAQSQDSAQRAGPQSGPRPNVA